MKQPRVLVHVVRNDEGFTIDMLCNIVRVRWLGPVAVHVAVGVAVGVAGGVAGGLAVGVAAAFDVAVEVWRRAPDNATRLRLEQTPAMRT